MKIQRNFNYFSSLKVGGICEVKGEGRQSRRERWRLRRAQKLEPLSVSATELEVVTCDSLPGSEKK